LLSRSWVKVKRRRKLCEGQPLCHSTLRCCLVVAVAYVWLGVVNVHLLCIACTGSYAAYADSSFALNPITDYAHLAGRGLIRHALPTGNKYSLFFSWKVLSIDYARDNIYEAN